MSSDRSGEVVQQVGQQLTTLGTHMAKRVDDLKSELQTSQQEFQTKLSSHVSNQIAEGIKTALQSVVPAATGGTDAARQEPKRFNIWGESEPQESRNESSGSGWKRKHSEEWQSRSWSDSNSWSEDSWKKDWHDSSWHAKSWKEKDQDKS